MLTSFISLFHLTQHTAWLMITSVDSLKFISKANGVYKRSYSFRMNIMQEIFEIRSCIELSANNIEVDSTDQYTGRAIKK